MLRAGAARRAAKGLVDSCVSRMANPPDVARACHWGLIGSLDELLKLTQQTVHIISTPFGSVAGRDAAASIKQARERPREGEFCYNPNEDCPQWLDVSWLDTWMAICDNAKLTGGKVFAIYRSDGKGQFGCDVKGRGSLDGMAQQGEIRYAVKTGCEIVWVDSCHLQPLSKTRGWP